MRESVRFGSKRGRRIRRSAGGTAYADGGAVGKAGGPFSAGSRSTPAVSVHARSWVENLFSPIDIASIAVFRISFGLLLLYDVYRYFARDWIKLQYIDPPYHFALFGFDFIQPLPGDGMYWLFAALGLCALLIALGLFYRLAITAFFIGFSYLFLIDEALYMNHFYLVGLLAFLMIFVPAARGWSLDAYFSGRPQNATVPGWSLWILRAQVEILLIYAGIVKLNADWLQGEPLGYWLAHSAHLPVIGPLLLDDRIIQLGAWGATLLHLTGAVLLLFRSTRLYAFLAYCVFHFLNHTFFYIGIFPWLTIAATLLFFDPWWPRTVWQNLRRLARLPIAVSAQAADPPVEKTANVWLMPAPRMRVAIVTLIVGWITLQVLVPLRHHLYPGTSSWHEQGLNFSWQMMLRQKKGHAVFYVCDPNTHKQWIVDPRSLLTQHQYGEMTVRPEMIRRFAHYVEKVWAERHGTRDVEVHAFTAASLNGRRSQALVDPRRDLTEIGYSFGNSDWIVPLTQPMPPREERWRDDLEATLKATRQVFGDSIMGSCR